MGEAEIARKCSVGEAVAPLLAVSRSAALSGHGAKRKAADSDYPPGLVDASENNRLNFSGLVLLLFGSPFA
jgi:hypothetical protein